VTRILHASTKLGRTTVWLGGLSVLLIALRWITGPKNLGGWAALVTFVFAFCGVWLISRWALRHLMWRLRNRLIVTYIFIGVIPIVLLLMMAGVGSYLFAGQFATYIVISNLHSALQRLEAVNDSIAAQLNALERTGKLNEQIAGKLTSGSDESFLQRTVTVWRGEKNFILSAGGALLNARPAKAPDAIKANFSGFVIDGAGLHLRAVRRYGEGNDRLTVISSIPITPELLLPSTSVLGSVTLIPPDEGKTSIVDAGRVPPPSNRFDPAVQFYTLFNAVYWGTGKSDTGVVDVATRPSMLYATFFATLGDKAELLRHALLVSAIFFGLIELVASTSAYVCPAA